jgi:ligand-binding SRPBCC domain-containing protein
MHGQPPRFTIDAMARQFETTGWVPFPVELVFAFFANPNNLPHIMPPEIEARIEDVRLQPPPPRPVARDPSRRFKSVAAGAGSEILFSFYPIRWLPQRVSWTSRVIEFEWNSHFTDEQVRGPFTSFRHRHEITADVRDAVEGTKVADSIEYAMPGGIFGNLPASSVWNRLEESFEYRKKRLPEILAIASRQAVQRL